MREPLVTRGRARDEGGQVLILVVLAMFVVIGFGALVIDVGRVLVTQRQLQEGVDAASLAAGQAMPNSTNAYNAAVSYSAGAGDKNAASGYGVTGNSPTVTFECLANATDYSPGPPATCPTDSSGNSCHPAGSQTPTTTTCNALKITETATVKTTFAGIALPTYTVHASAIAAARGGIPHPLNVFVILDNTRSMTDSCSSSVTGIPDPEKIDCAKAGVQALLEALDPCVSQTASCGAATANSGGQLGANVASPEDEVGMLVFPAIVGNPPSATTLGYETDCSSTSTFSDEYPAWSNYTYNAGSTDGGIPSGDDYQGYEAVGLSSDYRPSDNLTTLNWTNGTDNSYGNSNGSSVVESIDWGQCAAHNTGGVNYAASSYPGGDYYGLKDIGGKGTYLAGAITEGQHLLDQNARTGAQNAIVILSDGDMTARPSFTPSGSSSTPCLDADNAATQAKAAGTTIYTIEYDSSGQCGSDSPADTYDNADTLMQDMASSTDDYFDQPTAGDLTADFAQVGTDLTNSRLLSDCSSATSC